MLLIFTYYAYQHAGKFRKMVGMEDDLYVEPGGLDSEEHRRRMKRGKMPFLVNDRMDEREVHPYRTGGQKHAHRPGSHAGAVKETNWFGGIFDYVFSGDDEQSRTANLSRDLSSHPQGMRHARSGLASRERVDPNDNNRRNNHLLFNHLRYQEKLPPQSHRSRSSSAQQHYHPPRVMVTKNKRSSSSVSGSIRTASNRNKAVVVKVLDKHKKSFHSKKAASGGASPITSQRRSNNNRAAMSTESDDYLTEGQMCNVPQVLIDNLPTINELQQDD